ncbi:sodium:solute symporter family protein [soil metagenome]
MSPAIIWAAIAVYALGGLVVVLFARRRLAGGAEDFYLAGRGVKGLVSAASYAATTYSAFMMLGLAGLTYRGGVGAFGFELVYFAGLGLLLIFGPRIWLVGRRYGFITPSEMLGARYGSPGLGGVVAVLSCAFLVPYSSVQLLGIGHLLSSTTGGSVPVGAGILVGAALAAVWTLSAGLRSVAWTDAVQAVVIMLTALLALWAIVASLGGWGVFFARIEAERGPWLAQPGPGMFSFATFVGLSVPWFFFAISNPQVSQRLFTTRDLRAMRTMIIGVLSFGLVFTVISILWGFAALLIVPDLDNPDLATPSLLASGAVPAFVAVPLIVGIIAAAITTVDSIALTLASMVGRDVYPGATGGAARELLVGKLVILLVIGAASAFAYLRLDLISLLSVASSAGLLVTVPAIVGAFFWRRATAAGALSSVLGGAGAVLLLALAGTPVMGVPNSVTAFAVAIGLFVAVSLATRPPPDRGAGFIDAISADLRRMRVD